MENAKPGHSVEFHSLKGAAHLNGKRGHLIEYLAREQRWAVRCEDDDGGEYQIGQIVNAKPTNLKRIHVKPSTEEEIYYINGQYMKPSKTSKPVTAPSTVIDDAESLHGAVLGAFYNLKKGGVIVSYGNKYMIAIEFDGSHGNGGVYGQMAYVDRDPQAQAVVRRRGCQRATELGRNFLTGETIHYIDTTDERVFYRLLAKYQRGLSTKGLIDVKSGLKLYNVIIAK